MVGRTGRKMILLRVMARDRHTYGQEGRTEVTDLFFN